MTDVTSKQYHNYRFSDTVERGECVYRDGYHQPGGSIQPFSMCGCSLTTEKGAYRDVSVRIDGLVVHFYHQSAVVIEDGDTYILDSHGYRTMTTKQRMSRHLPPGYIVRQRDFEWFVHTPEGVRDFEDGMVIEA